MKYKKTILSLVIIITGFMFSSCDPPNFYHKFYSTDVNMIELIGYNNENIKDGRDISELNIEKLKTVETLDETDIDTFLHDLTELFIVKYRIHPSSPNANCIKIIFNDGTFELISENGLIAKYNENGDALEYIGMVDDNSKLTSIINKYFTII